MAQDNNKGKDMGPGVTSQPVPNHMMEYYAQVQGGTGYDECGRPTSVGHQSSALGGAGSAVPVDPTKHMKEYPSTAVKKNHGSKTYDSAKKVVHKLKGNK